MVRSFLMLALSGAMIAGPAAAQDTGSPDTHIADMLEAERAMIHVAPVDTSPDCPARDEFQTENTIIVCRRHTDSSHYRVPSTSQSDPRSREARRTGAPATPYVGSTHDCSAAEVHCHFQGYAPPPVYYLDTTTLPEPAEGTDAWKIAHGLMAGH